MAPHPKIHLPFSALPAGHSGHLAHLQGMLNPQNVPTARSKPNWPLPILFQALPHILELG